MYGGKWIISRRERKRERRVRIGGSPCSILKRGVQFSRNSDFAHLFIGSAFWAWKSYYIKIFCIDQMLFLGIENALR